VFPEAASEDPVCLRFKERKNNEKKKVKKNEKTEKRKHQGTPKEEFRKTKFDRVSLKDQGGRVNHQLFRFEATPPTLPNLRSSRKFQGKRIEQLIILNQAEKKNPKTLVEETEVIAPDWHWKAQKLRREP